MSVTVEVRGVPAGGGGSSQGGSASSGGNVSGNGFLPADDRLIADVRREMQSRGVLLVPGAQGLSQIISQYRKQLSDQTQAGIGQQFDQRREALRKRADEGYARIDREIEGFYKEGLESKDSFRRVVTEQKVKEEKEVAYRRLGREIDKEEKQIDSEEQAAKSRAETELTDAIKRLTDALEREAENNPETPNSYIGRLRQQQKDLIKERDTASDEAGAIGASKRLAEVNEKLRRAMTGEDSAELATRGRSMGLMNIMGGFQQFASAAGSANLGGMINGLGTAGIGMATAMGGLTLSQAAAGMGILALAAGTAQGVQNGASRYDQISSLAAFRGTVGGAEGREGGVQISSLVRNSRFAGSDIYDISRLGMSEAEFAQQAEQRIRARGMSEGWFDEVYRQIGLERNFALRSGALSSAGVYDRYGINSTEAITRLANTLAGIEGSGVTRGDFTRVQEKLDIQQQIMGSYMSRADRPNYDVANRAVAAMSAVRGITQDSRIGSDYAIMQAALQNPMNDRMKALVFGTIEDIIPGTRGRMDLIDQALRNPEKEGEILQAVIQRINTMYGGMDTQMGYFAFRNIFQGIAPDRLKDYIRDFSDPNSEASKQLRKSLRGSAAIGGVESVADRLAKQGTEYTSSISIALQSIQNNVQGIFDWLSGNSRNGSRSAQ